MTLWMFVFNFLCLFLRRFEFSPSQWVNTTTMSHLYSGSHAPIKVSWILMIHSFYSLYHTVELMYRHSPSLVPTMVFLTGYKLGFIWHCWLYKTGYCYCCHIIELSMFRLLWSSLHLYLFNLERQKTDISTIYLTVSTVHLLLLPHYFTYLILLTISTLLAC